MGDEQTIATLNELIRIGRDGEDFCAVASRRAAAHLAILLRQRGDEWGRMSDELQALVLLLGGKPARLPSLGARALHLAFAARARLWGLDESLILEGWQRLEHTALSRYEAATTGPLPARIRRTLTLQTERTRRRLQQVSGLSGHPLAPSPVV
jgi:uncharacterized protein (TIGR02284 family)